MPVSSRLVASRSLFGSCFVVCSEILPRWGVETVVVFADRHMCAGLRTPVDQSFVLEDGKRFPDGVTRDEKLCGKPLFGGQPVVIGARVDLVSQHVGDLTSTVGAGPPDGRRFGVRHGRQR